MRQNFSIRSQIHMRRSLDRAMLAVKTNYEQLQSLCGFVDSCAGGSECHSVIDQDAERSQ